MILTREDILDIARDVKGAANKKRLEEPMRRIYTTMVRQGREEIDADIDLVALTFLKTALPKRHALQSRLTVEVERVVAAERQAREIERETKCQYDIPWAGHCGRPAVGGYCEVHAGKTCNKCDKQATHGCGYTGQFVCGTPLCDNHKHEH